MLFMGEEYAEDNPFFYFVSHSDENLIRAVREGRKKEFEAFKWDTEPADPQDEKTFNDSKLQWEKRNTGKHQIILRWYARLIGLRKSHPALKSFNKNDTRVNMIGEAGFVLHRQTNEGRKHLIAVFNLSEKPITLSLPSMTDQWVKLLDSKDPVWLADPKEEAELSVLPLAPHQNMMIPPLSVSVYG